jgi:glucan phosphoethanolaminetransferase (alkaline phosphatase superfamily)
MYSSSRYKNFLPVFFALLILFFACVLMMRGTGITDPEVDAIFLFILIIICSSSRKVFLYFIIPLVSIYAIYTPIGLSFGPVSYQSIASILATDINESLEFLKNIPILDYFLGFIIVPLVLFYYKIIKKLNIKIYRNKTFLITCIILAMFNNSPFNFFKDTNTSLELIKNEIKILNDLSNKTTWINPKLDKSDYNTYILVIGESVRRDYLNAYGYPIKNTPFLSNSNGILVNGLTAAGNNTISSLRLMLTQPKLNGQPQYDKNFIDLANLAGFETYWLSNQGFIGKYDTPITAIAKKSKHTFFIKKGAYDSLNTSDYLLIPEFKKIISNKKKKLIVIHLYGSHPNACDRIEDYPKILDKVEHKYDEINCYISSIKKTDEILQIIYTSLVNVKNKENISFSMLYFSDHGLSSKNDNGKVVLRVGDKKQSYQTPLFMVNSDSINRKECKSFKSGLNFTNGIANWLGISNKQLPKYSLFNCKDDNNQDTHQIMLNNAKNDIPIQF